MNLTFLKITKDVMDQDLDVTTVTVAAASELEEVRSHTEIMCVVPSLW